MSYLKVCYKYVLFQLHSVLTEGKWYHYSLLSFNLYTHTEYSKHLVSEPEEVTRFEESNEIVNSKYYFF